VPTTHTYTPQSPSGGPAAQPLVAPEANAARSALAVAVGSLMTSALGGLLALLIALIVGESADTDAFFAAYSVYLFFTLFGASLRVALVPLLGSVNDEDQWRSRAAHTAGRLLGVAMGVTAAVVVLSPLIGRALTPGLPSDAHATAATSLAILAVASFCQIAAATLAAVLAAARRFAASAAAYVGGSAVAVALGAALMPALDVLGAAIGVLCGGVALLAGHMGYLRRFDFSVRPAPRAVTQRSAWRLAAMASAGAALPLAQQAQLTIALAAVSGEVGAVTAYAYASFAAVVLASVTIYVVGFVTLPGIIASLETHGRRAIGEYLDATVPIAAYLYVPLAMAYATFGRPVIDGVLGGSLTASSIDILWDCSRLFVVMQLAWVLMSPLSSIALALGRQSALVLSALGVLLLYVVAALVASSVSPVAVAACQTVAGLATVVPVLVLTLGRGGVPIAARALTKALPSAALALVIPAIALFSPEPSGVVAAVGLAVGGVILYAVIASLVWPSVAGRALRMLIARG
jgi:peptidoglycan biosynthesis protein MviN/MurJ (putative lipid II flippase)